MVSHGWVMLARSYEQMQMSSMYLDAKMEAGVLLIDVGRDGQV